MRGFDSRIHGLAPALVRAVWAVLIGVPLLTAADRGAGPGAWPRVHAGDAFTTAAVRGSLAGASRWLGDARCQSVFSDFRDLSGRPLQDKLAELGMTGQGYLEIIVFRDGSRIDGCARGNALAITTPASRVVFVCGREFARAWRVDRRLAQAVIIHEALHSLGLGENPPSSQAITHRVLQQCGW